MNNGYQVVNYEEVNRTGNEDIIQLQVKVETHNKKQGGKFKVAKVLMYLRCFKSKDDGSYVDLGFKHRWIDLKFRNEPNAFTNDCYEGCIIKSLSDLASGLLYVNANYIDKPSSFKVIKEKNDKGELVDKYPEVWIRGGLIGFQKYKPTQDEFSYHPSNIVEASYDEETGEVVEDDSTNETFTSDDVTSDKED